MLSCNANDKTNKNYSKTIRTERVITGRNFSQSFTKRYRDLDLERLLDRLFKGDRFTPGDFERRTGDFDLLTGDFLTGDLLTGDLDLRTGDLRIGDLDLRTGDLRIGDLDLLTGDLLIGDLDLLTGGDLDLRTGDL